MATAGRQGDGQVVAANATLGYYARGTFPEMAMKKLDIAGLQKAFDGR